MTQDSARPAGEMEMSWGMMLIAAAWTATPWAAVEIRQGAESMKSGPACTSLSCEGLVLLKAEGWRMHRPAGTLFMGGVPAGVSSAHMPASQLHMLWLEAELP